MINDEEDLLLAVRDYVKENLNTHIAAINTEKGDFTIDQLTQDNKHYVIAGELYDLPNNIFCQVAFDGEQIAVKSNHNDRLSEVLLLIEVAFDNPKNENTYFKSLRYMRALYQTMLGFESSAVEVDGLKLTKAVPMFVTMVKRELVVSGVGVSIGLG